VAQEPAQVPTLKATVNLVNLFATVRDKNRRIVGELQQKDFKIYEDNHEQTIAFFSKEVTLPITLDLDMDYFRMADNTSRMCRSQTALMRTRRYTSNERH
jgi:hypothetical protein